MSNVNLQNVDGFFASLLEHFKTELVKLKSGRANPDMVSGIKVDAYGQSMPLEQLANINVVDPTLLAIQPWDKTLLSEIKKSIEKADIGIAPIVDSELIRLPIPPLTQERRMEYVKLLKQKTEEQKIRVRQLRKDLLLEIEESEKKNGLGEDERKRQEKELQEKIDKINKEIDVISAEKEQELMKV